MGVAILLTACGVTGRDDVAATPRPHVLLISLDACRADHLGCYGYGRATSPFLDELAARGTRFSRAFINTHGTPTSHTTLLSSVYQETHRVGWGGEGTRIPEAVVMIQEALSAEGYLTIGVTGGARVGRAYGFERGFFEFTNECPNIARGSKQGEQLIARHLPSGQPLFVFLHTYEVHSPYKPPPRYRRRFGSFDSTFNPINENLRRFAHATRRLAPEDLSHIIAQYDAGIRYTDDSLRRLFSRLEEMGFLDRAVVVVTADHGEEFGDHGGLLHRDLLYDELLHVPLIMAGQGVPEGRVDEQAVSAIDVVPTLLALVGLEPWPGIEGQDLLAEALAERPTFAQYGRKRYTVRIGAWKLIETLEPRRTELYNIERDPGERHDLSESRPARVSALRNVLLDWKNARPVLEAESGTVALTDEERSQLRALGYED